MTDIVLESVRAVVVLSIVVFLWRAGQKRFWPAQDGWNLILGGFSLLLLGSVFDITHNFESLNRLVIIGDTEAQAFIEKFVGFLGGFVLLAVGLARWVPSVQRLGEEFVDRTQAQGEIAKKSELLEKIFEIMSQGIVVFDGDLNVVTFNENYVDLWRYPEGFIRVGMPFEEIARFRARRGDYGDGEVEDLVREHIARQEKIDILPRERVGPDGAVIAVERDPMPGGGYISTYIDLTDRKRVEEQITETTKTAHLLQKIAVAANEATNAEHALQVALDEVCAYTGWPMGHVYAIADDGSGELAPTELWHLDDAKSFKVFRRVTMKTHFTPGVGLPGRVSKSGAPVWIVDVTEDSNFPRAKLAKEIGVGVGFAFPVLVGKEVVAVLEFFSEHTAAPDTNMLEVMAQVGTLLGRVFEREQAEVQLRKLSRAVEQSPASVIVTDTTGNIEYVNPKFTEVTGYAPEEVIGRNPRLLNSGHNSPEEYRELWRTITSGGEWRGELRNKKKNGEFYWEFASISAIRDADGKIINFLAVKEDITRRKASEVALRDSEARLKTTLDNLLEGVITIDESGVIQSFNPAAESMFGYTEKEVVGANVNILMPEPDRGRHDSYLKHYLKTGEKKVIGGTREVTGRRQDGTAFPLDLGVAEMRLGAQHFFVSSLHDISERKKAEEALRKSEENLQQWVVELQDATERYQAQSEELAQFAEDLANARDLATAANRAKSEFLALMSHELRTPLNAIIGFSEIIKREMMGPVGTEKYRDYAADIHSSGQHLLGLINDILDLSKIEAGKFVLLEEDVDVADAIHCCAVLVGERALKGGVKIEVEIADRLPALHADERKLKQILLNLLSNAVKFTDSGGTVTVRAWCTPESGHVFQVEDTGIGIALADIPKVFTPFGQIDSKLARKIDGTGLGLTLTKSLVEMHGGYIDIQSQIDIGTTVTVRFPVARAVESKVHILSDGNRGIHLG